MLQFGANVLLDPSWDMTHLGRCSKTFRAVVSLVCASRPPVQTSLEVYKRILHILGDVELSDHAARLISSQTVLVKLGF